MKLKIIHTNISLKNNYLVNALNENNLTVKMLENYYDEVSLEFCGELTSKYYRK